MCAPSFVSLTGHTRPPTMGHGSMARCALSNTPSIKTWTTPAVPTVQVVTSPATNPTTSGANLNGQLRYPNGAVITHYYTYGV